MGAAGKDATAEARGRRAGWAALAVGAAAILVSLPFTWFGRDNPVRDEVGHIPLVKRWAADPGSVSVARFPEPKGVALLAAAAAWGRIFGTHCAVLRALVVILAIAALAAWMELLDLWGIRRRFAAGVSILVVPYFFIYSQMLYTEVPSLLLALVGLICAEHLRRTGRLKWALGVALPLGVLPWVRQTFLIVPAALIVCSWWMGRYRWRVAAAAAVACLSVVGMLALWGGIVPPGEQQRFLGEGLPHVRAFVYALAVLGALGWPALLTGLPRPRGRETPFLVVGALLAVVLGAAAPPDYGSVDRMGLLQKALISLPLSPQLPAAVFAVALLAGGLVLGRLASWAVFPDRPAARPAYVAALLGVLLCLGASRIFYDRYLIFSLLIVFGAAAERARRPLAWAFLAVLAAVTVAHVVYVARHPTPSPEPVPLARDAGPSTSKLPRPPADGCCDALDGGCHGTSPEGRPGHGLGPARWADDRDRAGQGRRGHRRPLPPVRGPGPRYG